MLPRILLGAGLLDYSNDALKEAVVIKAPDNNMITRIIRIRSGGTSRGKSTNDNDDHKKRNTSNHNADNWSTTITIVRVIVRRKKIEVRSW